MSDGGKLLRLFDRAVAPLLGIIAAIVLFGLMLITCLDVVGRYFFGRPVYGAFEITEMLLATLIFAALPLVTIRNEHVTVDVLDPITPEWMFRLQHVIGCAFGFVSTGYLAWRLWIRALSMDAAGETTAQLKFKLAYLTYAMSILMALTAVALLVLIFRRPQRHITAEL
jgi:TRAP-type C4-dicarboxylate transport system permease small subunit